MDLAPLQPIALYAAASLLTIFAMSKPRQFRLLSIPPVLVLSFWSLLTAKSLLWPFGLDSTFASLVTFYHIYSIKILALDHLPCNPEESPRYWSFVECYKIWNNPRNIQADDIVSWWNPQSATHPPPRRWFTIHKSLKAALLWTFDSIVVQRLLRKTFSNVKLADFSSAMELPGFRLLLRLSTRQLLIRFMMSVQWIWSAYFFLEFYHCLLSILFVSILRFDRPNEWSPLFGSPLKVDSLRDFWGRFWHRLTVPTYLYYSRRFSRDLIGLQPGSREEKTLIPFCIFTLSGLSHSLVGWAVGDAALMRDLIFFEINFVSIAAEIAFSRLEESSRVRLAFITLPEGLQKGLGMLKVFVFFVCVVPMWMFPKVHHSLQGLIL